MVDFNYHSTEQMGSKAAYGLVVLEDDETLENELRQIIPLENTALYTTRIQSETNVTQSGLNAMQHSMGAALSLLPKKVAYHCMAYGCTSASAVLGADKVTQLLTQGRPQTKATNPLSALLAGAQALSLNKVAFLSPYIPSVSQHLIAAFQNQGTAVTAFGSFNESNDQVVARIAPQSIAQAALALGQQAEVQGVIISCTNLRTYQIIADLEAQLNKPVLSSNQALAWQMLQLAQQQPNFALGRLFQAV